MSQTTEEIDQILETTPIPQEETSEPVAVPTSLRTIAKKIGKEYLELIDESITFYQHHGELSLSLPRDRGVYLEKVERHGSLYMIHFLTENFLSCLEAVKDHNRDYFAYQSDKVSKGKGKMEKVKMTYFVGKTTMKRVVQDANAGLLFKIFDFLTRSFESLTTVIRQEDGSEVRSFRGDYVQYVSEHFDDNKNFHKMGLVIDNVDVILSDYDREAIAAACEGDDGACGEEEVGKKKKKKKKGKKGSSGAGDFDPFSMFGGAGMGDQMGKNLLNSFESTKIGQLAKNISGKMRPEDFPMLSDPSRLLASLTNPSAEGGGIGDLIKFVMEEVQTTLKEENIDEKDLMSEAQGMMGGISKMTGMDPEAMMRSMASGAPGANGEAPSMPPVPDFSQFAGIFENLGKELQKGLNEADK